MVRREDKTAKKEEQDRKKLRGRRKSYTVGRATVERSKQREREREGEREGGRKKERGGGEGEQERRIFYSSCFKCR